MDIEVLSGLFALNASNIVVKGSILRTKMVESDRFIAVQETLPLAQDVVIIVMPSHP